MRVYFVGSHATGKTTLCRYVSRRYGLPMISEMARAVLAEMETSLDALRTDMDLVAEYQERVFARQVEVERIHQGRFVSDRAFDNLAYAAEHTTVSAEMLGDPAFAEYMRWVSAGVVFFLRPHQSLLREDGTRAGVIWDSVLRIDGMIKLMLEQYRVSYLPIESVSMQERVRAVEFVLSRAGLHEVTARRPGPPLPRVETQRPLFAERPGHAPNIEDPEAHAAQSAIVHAAALAETSAATLLPSPSSSPSKASVIPASPSPAVPSLPSVPQLPGSAAPSVPTAIPSAAPSLEDSVQLAANLSIETWPHSLRHSRDREI